ncbi:phosphotransferase family protein [Kineosporia babensis]|uniref:Aminoglycoside phosphotransferase family protein n=1 Tax=Kineosporia babensis TaxID=499548 RepID=A0A9X1SY71_9ACTN|nr:phosphotransferase [Kineosporia babensis]MCD5316569.1 aminoglycoside phosphotransferase family protein [Kineosporia babensis]
MNRPALNGTQCAAVLGRSLYLLGLRPRGAGRILPTGPGHRHRTVLSAPVFETDGRPGEIVLKFCLSPTPAEEANLRWEHQVTVALHGIADVCLARDAISYNPIPETLLDVPLEFPLNGESVVVSVRRFVPDVFEPLTARSLGQLIGTLHHIGSSEAALALLDGRPATSLGGLDAALLARALASPTHPFHARPAVVAALIKALQDRVTGALEADPRPLLVHRDLHPLNCVAGPRGAVALDWAEAGWGSRSDDFSWLQVAVARYGASPHAIHEARTGYEEVCPGKTPSPEQICAVGRAREVVCLAFSIMHAGRGPSHLLEALRELPILDDPEAMTEQWEALFNPGIFRHPMLVDPENGVFEVTEIDLETVWAG